MKLENLNNEKFALSSREMGKLVGGQSVQTGTKEGILSEREFGYPWTYTYSADCKTTTTAADGTTSSSTRYYDVDNDSCLGDTPCDPCKRALDNSIVRAVVTGESTGTSLRIATVATPLLALSVSVR